MTNSTSAHKEQPNPFLAEIKAVCSEWQSGGRGAPEGFANMFQGVLSVTVLKKGSGLSVQRAGSKSDFLVCGQVASQSEVYAPLRLNNGCFLHMVYKLALDHETKKIHTVASRIKYQADELGEQQIFRLDYERDPANHYPSAHLHVYGELPPYVVLPKGKKEKRLHHIHFPVVRPTLESVVRLLINDYGIETNYGPEIWGPVLDYTESLFFDNFTVKRTPSAPPQYIAKSADK